MDTGESELIFSLADAAKIEHQGKPLTDHWNYFNHLLVSPDSSRFIVLHRWKKDNGDTKNPQPTGGFTTRMFTVAMDGSDRCNLDPSGNTSHFIWKDPEFICAWTRPKNKSAGFYLMRDKTADISLVGEGAMTQNGHNTYVPNTEQAWILNDTYPSRGKREQVPYLYHVSFRAQGRFRSISLSRRISGGVAMRYSSTMQQRRQDCRHRLASRWQWSSNSFD